MKKLFSMLLCVCLVLGLAAPTAFAAEVGATVYMVTTADPSPLEIEIGSSFTFDVYISGTYDEFELTFPNTAYYTVESITALAGIVASGNQITASGLNVVDGARSYVATVNCKALSVKGSAIISVAGSVSSALSTLVTFKKGTMSFVCSHGSESVTVTTQPTCTDKGEKTHTCTICGTTWTSEVAALEHIWSSGWTDIGTQHKRTCTRATCGASEQADHNMQRDAASDVAASCLAKAKEAYKCSDCGAMNYVEVGELGSHVYSGTFTSIDGTSHGKVCTVCNSVHDEIGEHTFDSFTDNGDGTHGKTCSACGYSVGAESHAWVRDASNDTTATCLAKAKEAYKCECGATKATEVGELGSHVYSGTFTSVDGTSHGKVCTVCNSAYDAIAPHAFDSFSDNGDGTHGKSCSACGYSEGGEAHAWTRDAANDTAATCLQKAKEAYACACGASKFDEVEGFGPHKYDGGTVQSVGDTSHRPVCDVCGIPNGTASEHTFAYSDLGSGLHAKACTACGYTVGSESHVGTGHEVTEAATCISKAKVKYTCSLCGGTWEIVDDAGELGPHSFGEATKVDTSKHKQTCSICGLVETVAHTFSSEWKPNGDGLLHYRDCACGAAEYLPHTWDTGIVLVEPTETSVGLRKYICTGCGTETEEQIPMTDHEHSYSDKWSADGSNHWKACSCGDKTEIKPHTFDEGRIEVAPTCKTVGKKVMTCTVCGEKKTEDIPLVDHTFSEATVTKEPTCTAAGEKTGVCTVCGATETAGVPALGHTAGEFEVTENATCKQIGKKVQKCTTCGTVLKEEAVPMTEHNYGEWVDANGVLTRTCTECGNVDTKIDRIYVRFLEDETYGFKIDALEGDGFLEGWRLIVQDVTSILSDSERTAIVTAAKALNKNYFAANTFNIWLEDASGNRVEYSGKMKIEFPKPIVSLNTSEDMSLTIVSYIMAFVNEDGGLEPRETEIKEGNATEGSKVNFKTEGLGQFCLLCEQSEPEQSKGMDTWLVILIAIIAIIVPVGAFLIIFFGRRKNDEEEDF